MGNKYEIKKIDFCEVCHKPKPEHEITTGYEFYEIFGRIRYQAIKKCLECLNKFEGK